MKTLQILLVEDNENDAELVKEKLKESKLSYDLTHLEDGMKALAYLSKQSEYRYVKNPDVLLLDSHLPYFTGVDILRFFGNEQLDPKMKIFVFVSSEHEKQKFQLYDRLINGYLCKPFSDRCVKDLSSVIKKEFEIEDLVKNQENEF